MERETRKQLEKERIPVTKDTVCYDEIRLIREMSSIAAQEAMWGIHGYDLCRISHVVTPLAIHEEGGETVCYEEGEEEAALERLVEQEELEATSALTAWMKLNRASFNVSSLTAKACRRTKKPGSTPTGRSPITSPTTNTRSASRLTQRSATGTRASTSPWSTTSRPCTRSASLSGSWQ